MQRSDAGWHLDYVEVVNKASGATAFFVCHDWVRDGQRKVLPATAEDPRQDQVTYKASMGKQASAAMCSGVCGCVRHLQLCHRIACRVVPPCFQNTMWIYLQVVVHTSDIKAAGTDASVFLTLRGDRRSSAPISLSTGDAVFERGQADTFTLQLPRLGRLSEAVVGHDGGWGRGLEE